MNIEGRLKECEDVTAEVGAQWEFTKAFGVRSAKIRNEVNEFLPICAETKFSVGQYIANNDPAYVAALLRVAEAAIGMLENCEKSPVRDPKIWWEDFKLIQQAVKALQQEAGDAT